VEHPHLSLQFFYLIMNIICSCISFLNFLFDDYIHYGDMHLF
jgi:hypothetical protein